ncbi:MAG: phosphomannomutase/phosphoglucomutase [bacterium]|nr:phosphomannomutase/phosphoglucomutase [bacterium]
MNVEPSIFKAYDIRGLYPSEVNADVAYAIARAYATLMLAEANGKRLRIAVGSDARLSSPELKANLIRGLTDSGLDVEDIGLVSTPTFYFSVGYFGYDGGIQVSASHNPKEWNGFKLARKNAIPMSGDSGIKALQATIESETFAPLVPADKKGTTGNRNNNVVETEIKEQMNMAAPRGFSIKPFKIAIDPANGMGSPDMKALFAKLPCTIVWMNEAVDGTFPAHPADPMKDENTADLRKKILAERCDMGIASDGDGDRYFIFDEKGEAVPQAILRGLMAQIELHEHPGATVVYDVRPGRVTKEMIDEVGGTPVVAPVGHSLIKEKMILENAIFGGESSGHYFYKLPYGTFEAPVVLIYKFLAFLSAQEKPLSEVVAPYKRYVNSGEINSRLADRDAGLSKIEEMKKVYQEKQNTIDGLTVEYPEFWFNVRLSNTEPLIRLIVEARDKKTMENKRDELLALIKA